MTSHQQLTWSSTNSAWRPTSSEPDVPPAAELTSFPQKTWRPTNSWPEVPLTQPDVPPAANLTSHPQLTSHRALVLQLSWCLAVVLPLPTAVMMSCIGPDITHTAVMMSCSDPAVTYSCHDVLHWSWRYLQLSWCLALVLTSHLQLNYCPAVG